MQMIKEIKSEIGPAKINPSTPKLVARRIITGSNTNICRVKERIAPNFAFPIAGKKVVTIMVVPLINVKNKNARAYLTPNS